MPGFIVSLVILCRLAVSVVENLIFTVTEIRPSILSSIYTWKDFKDCCSFLFRISVLQVTCNYVFPPFVAIGALKMMRPRVTTVAIQTLGDLVCLPICV